MALSGAIGLLTSPSFAADGHVPPSAFAGSAITAERTHPPTVPLVATGGAGAPLVATGGAGGVAQSIATITGTVDAQGLQTSYEFDLGTSAAYGTPVYGQIGPEAGAQNVTLSLQNLQAATVYHYRLVATNPLGATVGADQAFTTLGFVSPITQPTTPALLAVQSQIGPAILTPKPPAKLKPRKPKQQRKSKKKKKKKKKRGTGKKLRGKQSALTFRDVGAGSSNYAQPVGSTPSIEVKPNETTQADEPSGYSLDLNVPQSSGPEMSASPPLKEVTVTLPAGVTLSLPSADGLEGCSQAQIAIETNAPGTCPAASQIATATVQTPLQKEPLQGQVFLGTPECAVGGQALCPDADQGHGSLVRVYIEAEGSAGEVKIPGTITTGPSTGELTARFIGSPELPFSRLQLSFKGGSRAILANPATCGTYTTTSDLSFSSGGLGGMPDANPSSVFNVDWDGAGGACPATLPFSPSFSAGTSGTLANSFSPLTVKFARSDRQQTLSQFSLQLSPGLLGVISSVPLCAEPQASLGTCGAASLIGHTTVAAGPGPHPLLLPGSVYLSVPYKGAPFGLSIVVPIVAGPFDLGNVVVRAAINVDPHDAHAIITSDPLPQVLAGIPLRIQSVNVTIDRERFIFNPTNCVAQNITATIASGQGAAAGVSNPFAASGCNNLPFSPKMTASTQGRASRLGGASLEVKIVEGVAGEANAQSVKVELPKALPSRLTTLQKACLAAVFEADPANCPAASIVGTATATTPLLPVPVSGPAFFVSHGGEAFPSLIVVLQGYGVTVDLVGSTFIDKSGISSSTFKTIPDVPVIAFDLTLPEGRFSALTTNLPAGAKYNLCGSKLVMPTVITAQNGAVIKQATKIAVSGCPKAKKTGKKKRHRKRKKGAKRSHRSHR